MGIGYQIASTLLSFLEFAMFARAILSWFPQGRESRINELLYCVTEPIIMPFRKLLEPFQRGSMIPIDFAFLLAFLMLGILQQALAYGLH